MWLAYHDIKNLKLGGSGNWCMVSVACYEQCGNHDGEVNRFSNLRGLADDDLSGME